jgi:FkbM family methyltransferase
MLPRVLIAKCEEFDCLLFSVDDLISKSLLRNGSWENHLHVITKFFLNGVDKPLVLDIGANLGSYAIPVGKLLAQSGGTLYAFEPQRIIHYQLCGNIVLNRLDNVFAFNQAVGEHNGVIQIPVPDYSHFSNIGSFSIEKKYMELQGIQVAMKGTETVPMITLDSLSLPKPPSFIKLDVEGHELNVLRGGINFLKNSSYPPIIFEAWEKEWFQKEREELLGFVKQLGYEITSLGDNDYIAQHQSNPVRVDFATHENGRVRMTKINQA